LNLIEAPRYGPEFQRQVDRPKYCTYYSEHWLKVSDDLSVSVDVQFTMSHLCLLLIGCVLKDENSIENFVKTTVLRTQF
jgi:hypothetical protein